MNNAFKVRNTATARDAKVMLSEGTCILIDAQQQALVVPMPDADKLKGVDVPALRGPSFGAGWTFRRFIRYHGPIVPTFVEEQR